ncbi:MAG TPA: hypothetical protein VGF76_05265 [Polyangiaceae bacterium]
MRNRLLTGSLPIVLLLLGQTARALPGSHAPAISTYDTRASSVVLAYRHGASDAGPFNTFSYNANFSSSSGKLSAQFGLHYVDFASKENDSTAHGIGASGVALFVFPVAGRYDDGVPKAAIAFDVGAVPTAYVSGQRNFLTVPLVLGFGVPLSPHQAVTITPWFEIAPSANLDTVFKPGGIQLGNDVVVPSPGCDLSNPISAQQCKYTLNQSAIEAAVQKGVTVDLSFKVPMRAGLDGSVHLGENADFSVYSGVSTLGGGFSGSSVFTLGAGLTFRWDDIVPAVLPVERRLDREGCDAIESRFRSCPNSRKWLSPEQRAKTPELPANATQLTPTSALPTQAPAPVAPAPAKLPAAPPPPAAAPALPTGPAVAPPSANAPQGATSPVPGAPPIAAFPN